MIAIGCFLATIVATLLITVWAASKGSRRETLYAADESLSGFQNGIAIAGDFLSATTILGITALFLKTGWDTAIYYLAPVAGLALMTVLVAGPIRRLGKFSLGDVLTHRLRSKAIRFVAGATALVITLFYLVAQLVGAGTLISALFSVGFVPSVIVVGALMTIYVVFGGMVAASYVQMIKAILLIVAVTGVAVIALHKTSGIAGLFDRVGQMGEARLLLPGAMHLSMFSALSLGFGMVLGMVGMPHLLIRFFTVPNERQARRSVAVAGTIVAVINAILFLVIGPAVIVFVSHNAALHTASGSLIGGDNMATLHLARTLGGEWLFGAIAAVAFATILAVVAGLTIAGASAAAHDIYRSMLRSEPSESMEVFVFRLVAVLLAVCAVLLAMVFRTTNIAFLSALAFGVAASANFPILILALYWSRLTIPGAFAGGAVGLIGSVALIVLGPAVWVGLFHHPAPVFPSDYPALLVAPLAVLISIAVSLSGNSPAAISLENTNR